MSCACAPTTEPPARKSVTCYNNHDADQNARLRRVFGQSGSPASHYTAVLSSLTAGALGATSGGVGVKHGSYARYLAKLTSKHHVGERATEGETPRFAGKDRKVGLVDLGGDGWCRR